MTYTYLSFSIRNALQFTIPDGGIKAGQAFGFGGGSPFADQWEMLQEGGGLFDLSVNGDQVFIYCLDADDLPNIVWGFNYNGPWKEAGLLQEEYGKFCEERKIVW